MRKLFILLAVLAVSCAPALTVQNTLDFDRSEMVEVSRRSLSRSLSLSKGQRSLSLSKGDREPYILIAPDGTEVPYQFTHDGKLIFKADVPAKSSVKYKFVKGTPAPVDTVAVGSVRPDRLDDLLWENEHSGWRMYGPGTHKAGAATYGYDIFTKSVQYPVMTDRFDKDQSRASRKQAAEWKAQGMKSRADSLLKAISFHVDHGDGMDVYSVGASLGCGTAALLDADGKIIFPWCWESCEFLDNGPLRFTVKVVMDGGAETRIITCDSGAWMNKVVLEIAGPSTGPSTGSGTEGNARIVAGIVIHDSNPSAYVSGPGYIGYADLGDPNPGQNGEIYCGAVIPGATEVTVEQGHILLHSTCRPGFTYYFGSAWSKADIPSLGEWESILKREVLCRENPLIVK